MAQAPPARRGVKSHRSDDLGAFFSKDAASRIISTRAPLAQPGGGMAAGVAPPSPQQVLPRRGTVGRRASTGMYGAASMLGNGRDWRSGNGGAAAERDERKGTVAVSSSVDGNDNNGDGPMTVKEYSLDRSDKVHLLKDRFSQGAPNVSSAATAPPKRAKRRTSMSSEASEFSMDVEHLTSDHSSSLLTPSSPQQRSSRRSSTTHNNSSAFNMSNMSEDTFAVNNTTKGLLNNNNGKAANNHNSTSTSSSNTSSSIEVRRQQAAAKTDQIVESLVWFSFHTPRAVLEDLISNELDLYRLEQKKTKKKAATTTKKKAKGKKAAAKNEGTKAKDYKMSYLRMDDDDDDDDDDGNVGAEEGGDVDDNGSHDDSEDMRNAAAIAQQATHDVFDGDFSQSMKRLATATNGNKMMVVPKSVPRQSALLFVDMSGFTRLSTILDVESLSKVINSYFDMIVSEVIQYGGDILKFAGDAFFAEWKVQEDDADDDDMDDDGGELNSRTGKVKRKKKKNKNALAELNASLASISDLDFDGSVPKLSLCVLSAARCGASIVKKFSDYHVMSAAKGQTNTTTEAMLNVHCGVGVGSLIGLHVGDFREDPQQEDEQAVELRREFLVLGDPIDQVSRAADVAKDGEVLASPEAILSLGFCCNLSDAQRETTEPILIASRNQVFFAILEPRGAGDVSTGLQPYESLRMHCKALDHTALARLHLQMALYVHPVIRGDELGVSAAIQAGTISRPREELERRHRAEAELRSVLTIFIKAVISPRVTGMDAVDGDLYRKLCDIMHVTSRELDRYSGHLRQFIVDDKGVVLIATFGLRGSTFPNMISNNGLPAIFSIHRALKSELKVENRVGATFGKVYCGVVGGIRRHEFAVMGAPVNLAARLMSSKVNKGILVDEEVRTQADSRYAFNSLPPVTAKGYDKPVAILEPIENLGGSRRRKPSVPFVGRTEEKETILGVASEMLADNYDQQSTMIFLLGESGMGISYLSREVVDEIKKMNSMSSDHSKIVISARSSSTETTQRIPLSAYKQVFMKIVHDFCDMDGSFSDSRSKTSSGTDSSAGTLRYRLGHGVEQHVVKDTGSASNPSSLHKNPRDQWGDVCAMKDKVSKSMRELVPKLKSPSNMRQLLRKTEAGKKFLPSSNALSQSTHMRDVKTSKRESLSAQSLHRPLTPKPSAKESLGQSLHRLSMARSASLAGSPKAQSTKVNSKARTSRTSKDDSSHASFDPSFHTLSRGGPVPYFEKLCWVCEQIQYPFEYADIVGSQFLGLDGANPVTHVDGHIPTMDELSEFLALVIICIANYADLAVVVLDDFQWVDTFSWKVFQILSKKWDKLLLICAARSHDKQAIRRLTAAASGQIYSQQNMIEITLAPLDFPEIRQLISKVLKHSESAITDSFCSDIFQRTGGLPVYVVQALENIRRKKTVELDKNGILQWTAEGLKDKHTASSNITGVVMEETFLSRFDVLDARVRKVLQTCAVFGLSFTLSDVVKVHPEMAELDIEIAMEDAVEEMILIEQADDEDDSRSLKSGSTGAGDSGTRSSRSVDGTKGADRTFQFSHAMWRQNVLKTMLKERKIEIHRLIAESMERDQVSILEQSDISRLLTLFDHWKSCGDFCQTARLSLVVGARLEEWDLCAQSLELYEDALEMSFDTVDPVESDLDNAEWMQVAAKPEVLDYILRLHIRVGLCHQNLGDEADSIQMFEDAYNIIKTASCVPGMSKSLMMPIISSLCVLKLHKFATDTRSRLEQEKLVEKFVKEAVDNGNLIHIGRALAMEASYYARLNRFDRAFTSYERLKLLYNVPDNSEEMINEYGRDFAIECCSEAVQWHYLCERHEEAEKQADFVIQKYLPLLKKSDADIAMYAVFPLVQVLKLVGRSRDAELIVKDYVVRPYQEGSSADFWEPIFNPLAYLLDLIKMEDNEEYDEQLLDEVEAWVLDDMNHEYANAELEPKAHTILGEICWRLVDFKEKDDPSRRVLRRKAKELLSPVANSTQADVFLKNTAQSLVEAM